MRTRLAGAGRPAAHQVKAEVAHERPALPVDDHVVEVTGGQLGQLRMRADAAVGAASQNPAVLHRHHKQVAVRQPAEPRGLGFDLELEPLPPSLS